MSFFDKKVLVRNILAAEDSTRREQKDVANFVLEFSSFFPFFIILQQKEYKAFRKHLPYFKGNSKCFAWLQQLKSFFFFNISIESVTLVHAQLQK